MSFNYIKKTLRFLFLNAHKPFDKVKKYTIKPCIKLYFLCYY